MAHNRVEAARLTRLLRDAGKTTGGAAKCERSAGHVGRE